MATVVRGYRGLLRAARRHANPDVFVYVRNRARVEFRANVEEQPALVAQRLRRVRWHTRRLQHAADGAVREAEYIAQLVYGQRGALAHLLDSALSEEDRHITLPVRKPKTIKPRPRRPRDNVPRVDGFVPLPRDMRARLVAHVEGIESDRARRTAARLYARTVLGPPPVPAWSPDTIVRDAKAAKRGGPLTQADVDAWATTRMMRGAREHAAE